MFQLNKFSLIITTRCNLRCKLCCEYVPQNKPFPDMTIEEELSILEAFFRTVDRVSTLHLTGGGEPFLHPQLSELIECAFMYEDKFDRLMLFSNSTIPVKAELADVLIKCKNKLIIQLSQYGINPKREAQTAKTLLDLGINCKIEEYYGNKQAFGGWVDFGQWQSHERTDEQLADIFQNCAVTRSMLGNWRTRNGEIHWCSRSQRGTELGLLPVSTDDYVDLFDGSAIEEKRAKFLRIENARALLACNYCSGDQGTSDTGKRISAAEQMEVVFDER